MRHDDDRAKSVGRWTLLLFALLSGVILLAGAVLMMTDGDIEC